MMKAFILLSLFLSSVFASEEQQIPLMGNMSPWFEISISPKTESFLISIESESNTQLYVSDLIDPNGKLYIRSNHGASSSVRIPPHVYTPLHSANRVTVNTKGLGSALIPNTPNDLIEPGVWKVRISALTSAQRAKVKIIQKNKLAGSPKLELMVSYHLEDWQAEGLLQDVLKQVETIYQNLGIELSLKTKLSTSSLNRSFLDEWVEEIQATEKSQGTIHLEGLDKLPGDKDLQGYAGCLPFFLPENKHCAIGVWFKKESFIETERITKVIAHEIGHFLGLYHLEDDYYPFGRLRSTLVNSTENALINIMHGTSEYFGDLIFTHEQIEVIKRHPLLYTAP